MTITINLPEDTFAALRADARAQGRPAEDVAAEGLAVLYTDQEDEIIAIEQGLKELEAGQGRPFHEFTQEFSRRFEERYGYA